MTNQPIPQPPGDTPTPRTALALWHFNEIKGDVVSADFARQLERELTASIARETELVHKCESRGEAMDQLVDERDALRQRLAEVEKERNSLNNLMRGVGWGQGEIDSAANYEEDNESLRAQLKTERAARLRAEEDTERLDWLERKSVFDKDDLHYRTVSFRYFYFAKDLRSSIDAALTPPVAPAPL